MHALAGALKSFRSATPSFVSLRLESGIRLELHRC